MSTLKADTIQSTGGGAATLTKQEAAKCYSRFNASTNAAISSFNQSSRSDDGTGLATISFTNTMGNANYVGHHQNADTSAPTTGAGAYVSSVFTEATGSVKVAYGYSGGNGGTTWTFFDYHNQKFTLHGDLA